MSTEQPVTCLLPPPLPPKTKSRRPPCTTETIAKETEQNKRNSDGDHSSGDDRDEILISASYSPRHHQELPKKSAATKTTTVNLNTVELNVVPDGFRELTYSCKDGGKSHVVKILINPDQETRLRSSDGGEEGKKGFGGLVVGKDVNGGEVPAGETCIRISVNNNSEIFQNSNMVDAVDRSPHYFFHQYGGIISSGQISPSDTLDSGTCSDLDGTPPLLQKKKTSNGVSVTLIGSHKKTASVSSGAEIDSDDNESHSSTSSISCDSLNCGKMSPIISNKISNGEKNKSTFLPPTLLKDIRQRKDSCSPTFVDQKTYEDRQQEAEELIQTQKSIENIDLDMFYNFHLNEKDNNDDIVSVKSVIEDETFAGYKDLLGGDGAATIRSAKGTVRGVKNRVRAGIATFLQINSIDMNYKEKDAGKVVVYTTSMGIIRDTYQACMKVKQILRTLLIKFEERDVFMSTEFQNEIRERMKCDQILVPQLYVDGQHCGDAETVERLNESGELRKILKPYKNPDACTTCQSCGGYRLLPCGICNGSKKSVHRNHFTTEFVALKCMTCDENGLVRCSAC